MSSDFNVYNEAARLAEQGDTAEALRLLQTRLQAHPDDGQAHNDAGAVLYCMGRAEEALAHLEHARRLLPDSAETLWNLAETYLSLGNGSGTAALVPDMERLGLVTPDLLNRIASAMLDSRDKSGAMEMLLKSLSIAPAQDVLQPMIQLIKSQRPKIAFFCGMPGDDKFLTDIVEFCRERFEIRVFEGSTATEMAQLMQWCDIAWFEWCTRMAVEASRLPKTCRMIVRLHDIEAYQEWPAALRWEKVDKLILVGNSAVRRALLDRVPDIDARTSVLTIPNGVNAERYRFREKPRGKNIACVGYLNMRKNPMLLLQCMQKLRYIDPGYRLFFAGNFQDDMLRQYCMDMVRALGIEDGVVFEGWQSDVNAWLQDKHYIVSASIGESQGIGLLDGMACGLRPVIHRFPGVEEIFPAEYVFNISEDFCRMITEAPFEPAVYRRFVESRYPLCGQLRAINDILISLETAIDRQPASLCSDFIDIAPPWAQSPAPTAAGALANKES